MLKLMFVHWDIDFVNDLMAIWPDPEKPGKFGVSQSTLSRCTGIAQSAISKYLNKDEARYPDSQSLRAFGKFFKVVFTEDWGDWTNNNIALQSIKELIIQSRQSKAA